MTSANIARRTDFWWEHASDEHVVTDDHGPAGYPLLARAVSIAAADLSERGIGHGDRVCVLASARTDVFLTLFACAELGAVMVPLNTRLVDDELAWIVADCAPALSLGDADMLSNTTALRGDPVSYESLDWIERARAAADDPRPESIDAGNAADDLLIVYTSGTTGRPKGAVLTQLAISAVVDNGIAMYQLTSDDRALLNLPLFHVGGLNIIAMPTLLVGGAARIHARFDPTRWMEDVASFRPTVAVIVPAMMSTVIDHPQFGATDLSSFRLITAGSSTIPDVLIDAFLERGVGIGQVYGLTESGPTAIHQDIDDVFEHRGNVGGAALLSEYRLVDPAGADVPPGGEGEILLSGPNLLDRYWNNPEATVEAFSDGWFRTGDVGRVNEAGHLVVCGRLKDMIISGGENIYPAELEAILAEDPRFAESTVVGRPDDTWGEVPVAVVVAAEGAALSEADVLGLFADRVARFKHPKRVAFVDTLPRNALGKLQKHRIDFTSVPLD